MKNRSVLIVRPEGFWSSWLGATSRIMDIAHGLRSNGFDLRLLAARKSSVNEDIEQEASFPGDVIRTPFFGAYPYPIDQNEKMRRMCRLLWRLGGYSSYIKKMEFGWSSLLEAWVANNRGMCRPDIIWAISTGTYGGLVGGRCLARLYSCPLLLEIHDPLIKYKTQELKRYFSQIEDSCISESAAVITTTESLATYLKNKTPGVASKINFIHSTFDGSLPLVQNINSSEELILLHAGALEGGKGRNARSLVEGLAMASQVEPLSRGKIKLRLLGGGAGGQEVLLLAKKLSITDLVEVLPRCAIEEAYQQMDLADILVVIKYDDPEFDMQIPGKLFQYLGRGKPILGIMRKTEASEILLRSGIGITVNSDSKEISNTLIDLWRMRKCLKESYVPDWDYINNFSNNKLAHKLAKITDKILL